MATPRRPRALVCRADGFGAESCDRSASSGAREKGELQGSGRNRSLLAARAGGGDGRLTDVVDVEPVAAGAEGTAGVARLGGLDESGADEQSDGAVGCVLGDAKFSS